MYGQLLSHLHITFIWLVKTLASGMLKMQGDSILRSDHTALPVSVSFHLTFQPQALVLSTHHWATVQLLYILEIERASSLAFERVESLDALWKNGSGDLASEAWGHTAWFLDRRVSIPLQKMFISSLISSRLFSIIAVHGLNGDPTNTWKHSASKDFWL